ncbi:unnamed protein product [Linum tenue]|uniref:Uncharacterized protein n=1 Tax=Linum tenue TaxID=586396 RepID=A0AAV0MI60_9ROSI|nr:unnamed protein product [Linum tenue]
MPSEGGYLEAEGIEKTWWIKQDQITREVDILSSRNQYDIVLNGLFIVALPHRTFICSIFLFHLRLETCCNFLLTSVIYRFFLDQAAGGRCGFVCLPTQSHVLRFEALILVPTL